MSLVASDVGLKIVGSQSAGARLDHELDFVIVREMINFHVQRAGGVAEGCARHYLQDPRGSCRLSDILQWQSSGGRRLRLRRRHCHVHSIRLAPTR